MSKVAELMKSETGVKNGDDKVVNESVLQEDELAILADYGDKVASTGD